MRKKGPVVRRVEHPKFPIDFFEHCQMLQYNEIEVKEEREWEEGGEEEEGECKGGRVGEMGERGEVTFLLAIQYTVVYCSMQRNTDFLRTTPGATARG